MKAIQLSGIKKIEIINIDKPSIRRKNEVLIKVNKVGICGSDNHYYKSGKIGDQIVTYPFIIGHEMSGTVENIGARVSRVKIHDKIAIDPLIPCCECDQCLIGRYHTCRNQNFLGCPGQIDGCTKEYIVLPERCCYPIPPTMSYENAMLCEPLSIGYYATSFIDSQRDIRIGILGAGPIGLSVLLVCRAIGITIIYVTDLLGYRLKTAQEHGAYWIGNPEKSNCVKEINDLKKNQLDYVFECSGTQDAVEDAMEILKPGGKLILIGIPEYEKYMFNAHLMRRKEITIQNIRRQNEYINKTINLIEKNKIDPCFMITHNFTLSEVEKAFQIVTEYKDNVIKAVINID